MILFNGLRMCAFGRKVFIITLVVSWIIILIVWYFFITRDRAIVNYLIDFAKFHGVCSTFWHARRADFRFSHCCWRHWPDGRVSAFSTFFTCHLRSVSPILVDYIHVSFISLRHLLFNYFSLAIVGVTLRTILTCSMSGLAPLLLLLASGAFLILLFDVDNVLIQEVVR